MKLYVKPLAGGTLTLQVDPTFTISDVKNLLFNRVGISPDKQRLTYRGRPLENAQTLAHYNIQAEYMIWLLARIEDDVKIHIFRYFPQILSGKRFTLTVLTSDTIRQVKVKIQGTKKIPLRRQKLIFAHKELEDQRTLASYNIQKESTVFLLVREMRRIFVKGFTMEISLEVEGACTIGRLKAEIQQVEGIPVSEQKLVFDLTELEDHRRVADYSIPEDSTLIMFHRRTDERYLLAVKFLNGKKITLEVELCDTIRYVKRLIQEAEGIPPHLQRLAFDRWWLQDFETLHGINANKMYHWNRILFLQVD